MNREKLRFIAMISWRCPWNVEALVLDRFKQEQRQKSEAKTAF